MQPLILIGFGAGLGGILRYLLVCLVELKLARGFPYGTLLVNLLGSFCMGLLIVLIVEKFQHLSPVLQPLLLIGLLGGFTTFSAFAMDTVALLNRHMFLLAAANMLLSCVGCVSMAWLGCWLAYYLSR